MRDPLTLAAALEEGTHMKWDRMAIVAVVVLFTLSYAYSGIKRLQLSGETRDAEEAACEQTKAFDCVLIERYHDECFDPSYRAEYRIRSFHVDEYRACMDSRIRQHGVAANP